MADVTLSVTIPDAHVVTFLSALNGLTGEKIQLKANGIIEWKFLFGEKLVSETNKKFAERYLKEIVRATVRLYKYREDTHRYALETLAIPTPSQTVPDEIVV